MLAKRFEHILHDLGMAGLEHPLFYHAPVGIRFKIGGEEPIYLDRRAAKLKTNPAYIQGALDRAAAIYRGLPTVPELLRIDGYPDEEPAESLLTEMCIRDRMTYEQVLCPNDTLLLNNSYLLEQFSLRTHEITPFANKKNSMKAMLDASGDLALWYTGEEIVACDFGSNTEVWRETVKCKKSKDPNFAYYCFGMLSPRQSKAAYRVTEGEYVLVDLKSAQKTVISNESWHPFFSPDDQ